MSMKINKLEIENVKRIKVPVMNVRSLSKMDMWLDRIFRKNLKRKNGRQVHFKWRLREVRFHVQKK